MTENATMQDVVTQFKQRMQSELKVPMTDRMQNVDTKEYSEFRNEFIPRHLSWYEKMCKMAGSTLRIKPDKKKEAQMREFIDVCHLQITPADAVSFSVLVPLIVVLSGSLLTYAVFQSSFFIAFFLIVGLILMLPLGRIPEFLANNWRLQASNQMVVSIFYVVTFMRHTSNIENAINFAADHITGPLALDMKKILWDVETSKYESVKESLDEYLESWRKWNMEFIESMHLIESSLYESSEDRRLLMLDKSLDVMLTETYERMLHYAQNLKSPITMLHMLGIIMPILGLVILPLVVSFMDGVKWYHLATLYNVALPIGVYYLGKSILAKRPTGYGDVDLSQYIPDLKKFRNVIIMIGRTEIQIPPLVFSLMVFGAFFLIGLSPPILHAIGVEEIGLLGDGFEFLGYRLAKNGESIIGPFGIGASIVSLCIPLAFAFGIGLFYRLRSRNVMKIRNQAKKLENEFASGLFQLGNRLGDGYPPEIAFGKVADVMQGTLTGDFFTQVDMKIRKGGMSVKQAIFDEKTGVIKQFPSNLIESSMKVLIQSAKKGPRIAAQAVLNISRYIKEIHRVNERLKDLLADIISSMKSQINFMTPVIAGIVIGITSMVTSILGKLNGRLQDATAGGDAGGSSISGIANLFGDGVPTYYFQIIVGLYVVQIIYILTLLSNGIENGSDKLNEKYLLGRNVIRGPILYCIVAAIIMIIFNVIANQIMGSTFS